MNLFTRSQVCPCRLQTIMYQQMKQQGKNSQSQFRIEMSQLRSNQDAVTLLCLLIKYTRWKTHLNNFPLAFAKGTGSLTNTQWWWTFGVSILFCFQQQWIFSTLLVTVLLSFCLVFSDLLVQFRWLIHKKILQWCQAFLFSSELLSMKTIQSKTHLMQWLFQVVCSLIDTFYALKAYCLYFPHLKLLWTFQAKSPWGSFQEKQIFTNAYEIQVCLIQSCIKYKDIMFLLFPARIILLMIAASSLLLISQVLSCFKYCAFLSGLLRLIKQLQGSWLRATMYPTWYLYI